MKKNFLKTVLICFFGMLMAGCNNLAIPGKSETVEPAGRGLVRIYIGEANNARTLQPASAELEGYRLTFSGTIAHDPVNISSGNYADVYLADGTYTITAKAYKKDGIIGNAADEAASGSISGIVMSNGTVTSNSGVIPPIILAPAGAGNGVLHYQITREDYSSAESYMTLYQINGTTKITGFASGGTLTFTGSNSAGATGDYTVAAGRYVVEIKLVNASDEVAYYRDVVEIWSGVTKELIFAPNYINPDLDMAYSGAALSETLTTFGGVAIGAGSGTGASETNPKTYSIGVPDIEDATLNLEPDNDSLFADMSWVVNAGTAPDGGYGTTTLPTDFSQDNVVWVKMVSEDTTATAYYKLIIYPSLPTDLSFEDTDPQRGEIGGTISWTKPAVLTGISGYHIYFGSNPTTTIGSVLYTIADPETESQTIDDDTEIPSGAEYLIIVNYDSQGNDYPLFGAIPLIDYTTEVIHGDFAVESTNLSALSYASNTLSITGSGDYKIAMKPGISSTSTDRIAVTSGTANITITNVNINVSATTANAFNISASGVTVNLTVKGVNNFASGASMAGIRVPSDASLTITAASDGSLTARGGNGVNGPNGYVSSNLVSGGDPGRGGGAGIGGNGCNSTSTNPSTERVGTITIHANNISAYGGNGGNGGFGGDTSSAGAGGGGGGGAGIGGGGGGSGRFDYGGGGSTLGTGRGSSGFSGINGGAGGSFTITAGLTIFTTGGSGGLGGAAGSGGYGAKAGGYGGRGGYIGGGGGSGAGGCSANAFSYGGSPAPEDTGVGGRGGNYVVNGDIANGYNGGNGAQPAFSQTTRVVTIAMWDSAGNGWGNSAALRIRKNGTDLETNARLASGGGPDYYTFTVSTGDSIQIYWLNGGPDDREIAFAAYYSDNPPNPMFVPAVGPSGGTPDSGRVLASKRYTTSGAVGNGTSMGSFTVP